MAKKQKAGKSSVLAVFRGLKDTFMVVVLHKPIHTNFTPKEHEEKEVPQPNSDEGPAQKIGDRNTLIIEPEYQQDIELFLQTHSNVDVLEVPCYFNNEPCNAVFCAFPRLILDEYNMPRVHNVVSLTFTAEYSDSEQADYGVDGKDALHAFKLDLERLTPPSLKMGHQQETKQRLNERFPELDFEHPISVRTKVEPDEPQDAKTDEEKPIK